MASISGAPGAFAFDPNPEPVDPGERASRLIDPGFGRVFTDHMASIRYSTQRGWWDSRITARQPIMMDPASSVLHYAQEIFEGLKAYRQKDGGTALFRPADNARRFQNSARRLAMPELPDQLFLESIRQLVTVDHAWIPQSDDGALYLRPFLFADEVFLGVKPSAEYRYLVIASSVGAYFKAGATTISVWASELYTRASAGGTGAAKCGGNYAASLLAQAEATSQGCDQVVFLDAAERRYVEELGGMNIFFVFDDGSLSTPPLSGTILPGITRDSLITIAHDHGLIVREEPYTLENWRADAGNGRLTEAFACGTAAVVTPIGKVASREGGFTIGGGGPGETTIRLRDALVAIQRGRAPDPHGWLERLD